MSTAWQFLSGLLALAILLGGTAWILWGWLKRSSDEPLVLIIKWVATFLLLAVTFGSGFGLLAAGPTAAWLLAPLGAFCGLALTVLWISNVGGWVGNLFGGGMDGGNIPAEAKPQYSIAEGLRKRGRYHEAVAEIHRQLEKFPNDFHGETMLAEIHAVHLEDFSTAQAMLDRIANNSQRPAHERAYALNQLADWHLKFHHDADSARAALERLVQYLPDTEHARVAGQRIAHLSDPTAVAEAAARPVIALPHVSGETAHASDREGNSGAEPHAQLAALMEQLRLHPLDSEARENLARLYAEQFGRLDLALPEVEKLVAGPNQPARTVSRWLNLKADFQTKYGGDAAGARVTLERIAAQFPGSAFATAAEQRIASLAVEIRGKQKSQTLRLGSHENEVGLPD